MKSLSVPPINSCRPLARRMSHALPKHVMILALLTMRFLMFFIFIRDHSKGRGWTLVVLVNNYFKIVSMGYWRMNPKFGMRHETREPHFPR